MVSGEEKPGPTRARRALAANLAHLMKTYSRGFQVGLNPPDLHKASGVSAKTIRRMLDPYSAHSPKLDNLDAIAAFFQIETWDLLRPQPVAVAPHPLETPAAPKPSKPTSRKR